MKNQLQLETPISKQTLQRAWRLYLFLAAAQGVWVLTNVLTGPSGAGVGGFLPISMARLAIAAGILAVLLFLLGLFLETWLRPARAEDRITRLAGFFSQATRRNRALLSGAVLSLLGGFIVTLIPEIDEPFTRVLLDRLAPLIVWLAGMSALACAVILFLWYPPRSWQPWSRYRTFILTLTFLAGGFVIWYWIVLPFYPTVSQRTGWNSMGTPLVEMQLLAAWLAGMGMLAGIGWINHRQTKTSPSKKRLERNLDLLAVLLIWLATVIIWQSMPLTPSWFVSERMYPTFDYCPYSDARSYAMVAQDVLVGEGFKFLSNPFIRRSMHGLYLTSLTLIGGQNYVRVIFLQICVLAFFPVIIYLLTRKLYNRVAGVMAAAIILLREANAIVLADVITTSHVKLFMVDVFTAFLVAIFAYLGIRWLQNPRQGNHMALACGGLMGVMMLVRLETVVLIFPLLLLLLANLPAEQRFSTWMRQSIFFVVSITLIIAPWVWRNWKVTGLIFIDSPSHHITLIQQRFYPPTATPFPTRTPISTATPKPFVTPAAKIEPPTSETPSPVTAQQPAIGSPLPKGLKIYPLIPASLAPTPYPAPAVEEADPAYSGDPLELIRFTLIHYVNSQLQTTLIFPSTLRWVDSTVGFIAHQDFQQFWKECCSLNGYVRRLPYWHSWDGKFPSQSMIPLALNLLILAAGISLAWRQHRWSGLLPASLVVTYLIANAVFRNSGGRYLLPVDWASIIYFSIGLASLTITGMNRISKRKYTGDISPAGQTIAPDSLPSSPDQEPPHTRFWPTHKGFMGLILLLFLVGWSLPVMERIFPKRYTNELREQMLVNVLYAPGIPEDDRKVLQAFVAQGAPSMAGRMICPQYYPAGQGAPSINAGALVARPYPRLVFYLAGWSGRDWAIPVAEKPPRMASGDDALLITCWRQDIQAYVPLAVGVFSPSGELKTVVVRSSLPPTATCAEIAP